MCSARVTEPDAIDGHGERARGPPPPVRLVSSCQRVAGERTGDREGVDAERAELQVRRERRFSSAPPLIVIPWALVPQQPDVDVQLRAGRRA